MMKFRWLRRRCGEATAAEINRVDTVEVTF
jgi:hypothetical protein